MDNREDLWSPRHWGGTMTGAASGAMAPGEPHVVLFGPDGEALVILEPERVGFDPDRARG